MQRINEWWTKLNPAVYDRLIGCYSFQLLFLSKEFPSNFLVNTGKQGFYNKTDQLKEVTYRRL
jgi:hypothetical protein